MNDQVNYAKIQRIQNDLEALVIGQFGTGFCTDAMLYESGIKATVAQHTSQLVDIAVNVKGIGFLAKGDGVTDDTIAIQNALNSKTYGTVYFPDGDYLISSTLTINNSSSIQLSKKARIFTNTTMDDLIIYNSVNNTPSLDELSAKPFIKGGKLDGNNKVKNVLTLSQYLGFVINDVKIFNFLEKGLITNKYIGSASAAELICSEVHFRNNQVNTGSIAIYNNGRDNQFNDIIVMDVETAVWTNDGLFSKLHHWISLVGLIPNSCTFNINDSYTSITQCYADTIRYPYKLASGKIARIDNSMVLYNTSIYNSTQQTSYPVIIFSGDTTVQYYVKNNLLTVPFNLTMCQYSYELCKFVDNYIAISNGATVTNLIDYTARYQLKGKQTPLNGDLNNAVETQTITIANGSALSNFPANAYEYGVLDIKQSFDQSVQMFTPLQGTVIYVRTGKTGSWGSWVEIGRGSGTTGNRTTNGYAGYSYFDTTLGKPIWVKTAPNKEIDTLTVTNGATANGNITITLNGVGVTVAVVAGDTASGVATKIRATTFSGWVVGGSGTSVVFTKTATGVCSAPTFTDTGSTGSTGTFAVTRAGSATVWVDSNGTTV